MVRSMMSQTTLPKSFWDYALETAARILNMVPTKKVEKTPYEIWHDQAPKLSYLKFWGYPKETMGYSFYSPSENKVFVAQNAEFFESKLLDLKASGSVEDLELIQEEDTNPSVDTSLNHEDDDQEIDEPQSDINPIRKSFRTRRAPDRMCLYIDVEKHELGDLGEITNYKAVLLDPESKNWLDAMNVEIIRVKNTGLLSKSQTGYVFLLNGCAVDWKNAEYTVAFDASKEAVWIRKFIFGLGIVLIIEEPISMYCDNTGAIAIAKDDGVTKGARHFRAKVHYLCETIKLGGQKLHLSDNEIKNVWNTHLKKMSLQRLAMNINNINYAPNSSSSKITNNDPNIDYEELANQEISSTRDQEQASVIENPQVIEVASTGPFTPSSSTVSSNSDQDYNACINYCNIDIPPCHNEEITINNINIEVPSLEYPDQDEFWSMLEPPQPINGSWKLGHETMEAVEYWMRLLEDELGLEKSDDPFADTSQQIDQNMEEPEIWCKISDQISPLWPTSPHSFVDFY
nr:retrotransposon protein, putative, Ty1-copia subclass [Tanacetum cinerariifolium]